MKPERLKQIRHSHQSEAAGYLDECLDEIERLQAENERYREALEDIRDHHIENYTGQCALLFVQEIASKALRESEKD